MNANLPFTTSMPIQDTARDHLFQSQPFKTSIEYAVQWRLAITIFHQSPSHSLNHWLAYQQQNVWARGHPVEYGICCHEERRGGGADPANWWKEGPSRRSPCEEDWEDADAGERYPVSSLSCKCLKARWLRNVESRVVQRVLSSS